MLFRSRIGGLVGIRPVGDFHRPSDPAVPRPGERLGIFTVRAIDDDELLLGDDDVHLDFRMAIRRDLPRRRMVIAMALRTHNLLGRLYMIPVGPIHRRLVARMLARAVARGDV